METLAKLLDLDVQSISALTLLAAVIGQCLFVWYLLKRKNGMAQVNENAKDIAALKALVAALTEDYSEINTTVNRLNREVGVAVDRLGNAVRRLDDRH